jgi:hypothetical protein
MRRLISISTHGTADKDVTALNLVVATCRNRINDISLDAGFVGCGRGCSAFGLKFIVEPSESSYWQ